MRLVYLISFVIAVAHTAEDHVVATDRMVLLTLQAQVVDSVLLRFPAFGL